MSKSNRVVDAQEGLMQEPAVPNITAKDAQKILERQVQERIAACQKDLNAVMQKHQCALDPRVIISRAGVQPMVAIIPQPMDEQQQDMGG